jgi:hypothetical protein
MWDSGRDREEPFKARIISLENSHLYLRLFDGLKTFPRTSAQGAACFRRSQGGASL